MTCRWLYPCFGCRAALRVPDESIVLGVEHPAQSNHVARNVSIDF